MSLIFPWFFSMATLHLHFSVVITKFEIVSWTLCYMLFIQSVISLNVLFNDVVSNSHDSAKQATDSKARGRKR
jgi:hypothetical protein